MAKTEKGHGNEIIDSGVPWWKSALMSDNKRNKILHSTPLVCKAVM